MFGRISWEGWAVPPGHEAVRAIAAETPDSELIRWVDEALREKSGYTLPPKSTSPSRTATITMSCPAFMSGATSPW